MWLGWALSFPIAGVPIFRPSFSANLFVNPRPSIFKILAEDEGRKMKAAFERGRIVGYQH